jgi:hypothetical protein
MRPFFLARIVALILLVVIGGGIFLWNTWPEKKPIQGPVVTPDPQIERVGTSVEGRAIEAFTYGTGARHLLFVGGIHGGYEWNSVVLAYRFIDHLASHPEIIPATLTVTVIPNLNPDGVYKVVGKEGRFTEADVPKEDISEGRFNAHDVDLNRNFDCKWKPESTWRSKIVSAGTSAFSEPEARALRDFAVSHKPSAAVFWHSQANAVYASECEAGILLETLAIMNVYGKAAKYPTVESFDAYEVSGDAEGWLASINIPAITVELSTHETIEWEKNLAGVEALFAYFK